MLAERLALLKRRKPKGDDNMAEKPDVKEAPAIEELSAVDEAQAIRLIIEAIQKSYE